jgi:hypothetical protein
METVLFWMMALEIGAVAVCIVAIAQFEIRRRSAQRSAAISPIKAPVRKQQLDQAMGLKLPGRKRARGYDYPELCSKDNSQRLLKAHTVLTKNLQMH